MTRRSWLAALAGWLAGCKTSRPMPQDFLLEGNFDTGDFVVQLRSGSISIIKEEEYDDDWYTYQAPLEDDAVWVFDAGGKRYAVLWKYSGFGAYNSAQVASSTDNGATWTIQDEADGPSASGYGNSPVSVDHKRPASSATKLTVGVRQQDTAYSDGDGYHEPFRLCDFSFATQSWGAPYAQFYILDPSTVLLSSRPDGSILIVYAQMDLVSGTMHLYCAVWNGMSWTQYDSGISGAVSPAHLAVDADGVAHVIYSSFPGNYYVQISAAGSFGAPQDLSSLYASATPLGNLIISSGGELLVPCTVWSGSYPAGIIRGYPLSSPSWDYETIADSDDVNSRSRAVTQESDGKIAVYWNAADGGDYQTYKSVRNAEDDWQDKVLMWDSGVTPPQTSPPASSCSDIYAIIVLPAMALPSASLGWAVIGRGPAAMKLSQAGGYARCG